MLSNIVVILTSIFLFTAYTILLSHPNISKGERIFFYLTFGLTLLAVVTRWGGVYS
jgi:hypothetical protein